jgi:hypothetical protein
MYGRNHEEIMIMKNPNGDWQVAELEPSIEVYAAAFHLGQCSSILHRSAQ